MRISTAPGPAASVSAEPLMPIEVTTLTWLMPLRMRPTSEFKKRSSAIVMPPAVIGSAARMENGTAINARNQPFHE